MGGFELLYQRLLNFWLVLFATAAGLKLYGSLSSQPSPPLIPAGPPAFSSAPPLSQESPLPFDHPLTISRTLPGWMEEIPPEEEKRLVGLLNRLSQQELMEVRGIGQVLAGRIVDLRRRRSGLNRLSELMEVEGIGDKRARAIVSWLTQRLGR